MNTRNRNEFGSLLSQLINEAHTTSKEKGWYEKELTVPHSFMMVVDEICEAMQEFRKNGKTEEFTIELADVFIRLFDFMGYHEISGNDIMDQIHKKMEKNKERPYRHGDKPF